MNSITIDTPKNLGISKDSYIGKVKELLFLVNKTNKTVVPRTTEELESLFDYSMIAINEDYIIGHGCCFPAHMSPKQIELNGCTFAVGENGSIAVKNEFQNQGIGKQLICALHDSIGLEKYDIIIGGTIAPQITHIRSQIEGYEKENFPNKLYQEGLNYFSNIPEIGLDFFEKNATCHIFVQDKYKSIRKELTSLLLKQCH